LDAKAFYKIPFAKLFFGLYEKNSSIFIIFLKKSSNLFLIKIFPFSLQNLFS